MADIIVTGAGGFLGQSIVAAARRSGHEVRAHVRTTVPTAWRDDPGVQIIKGDLAEGFDPGPIRSGDTVIHAAANLLGDDVAHDRDTRQATAQLLATLPKGTRLVLVSSFSVYGYHSLQDWALLDETAGLETKPGDRDAYTRAKIDQEAMARIAAKEMNLDLRIARPGVLYGPGPHAWTPLLGWAKGPFVITMAPGAPIPAIHVEDCATWLVALAAADRDRVSEGGPMNLVSGPALTRRDWIMGIGLKPLVLPRAGIFAAAGLFRPLLPGGLRMPKLAARFKPLHYSNARAEACLGALPARDMLAALKETQ